MLRSAMTENGLVKGLVSTNLGITVYKGIPFAAPPVGENRWRAPQPCPNWEGALEAYKNGPIAVQDTPGYGDNVYVKEWSFDREIEMSEDCLYLNIWTPACSTEDNLPVLVWYYGGGLQWGNAYEQEFDGEQLAKRGIIVVNVGYRLGALGFLAHPDLTKEAPEAPANFGNLDQQAALKWVVRNIKAFGGNPKNITIAGQSAGGGSVMTQITSEQNYGLMQRAIVMSGVIRFPGMKDSILKAMSLEEAEKNGEEFIKFLGCSSIEEARKLDAIFIRDKYAEYASNHPRFATIIDGVFVKGDTFERFVNGDHADIEVMAGNTRDEFQTPLTIDGETRKACGIEYAVKAMFSAEAKRGGKPGYYYMFDCDIPGEDNPGTFHSVDLWFFFESLRNCWRPMVGRHYDLARKMANYWANFIKTGNPNGNDCDGTPMTEWKPYSEENPVGILFTGNGPVSVDKQDEFVTKAVKMFLE